MGEYNNGQRKYERLVRDFKAAAERLREALDATPDEHGFVRDSAIQRFEFCTELAWKTLKTHLLLKSGIECRSPKGCVREAFSVGIIEEDDAFWLEMIDMRNDAAHTYDENRAQALFERLPGALTRFESLLAKLEQES
jgi:nucleotidyltransferase substrate binding protein (TIGR01987 family)